jgi:hypothetical protein
MAKIKLDKQNKIQLLQWLQDGEVESSDLSSWLYKNEPPMTKEEEEDWAVRMLSSMLNTKPIYEDKVAQRVCKQCYKSMGCWVAWEARNDREMRNKIDAIFEATQ